jgi:hypothetical protein
MEAAALVVGTSRRPMGLPSGKDRAPLESLPRDEPCEASNKIVDHLRRQASRIGLLRNYVAPTLPSRVPGAGRAEKRAFKTVAAWSSFALFVPILLISRLA